MPTRFACLALLLTPALHAADAPRLTPGPDILVSRDGQVPHVELSAAANPRDPGNLVGSAITQTRNGLNSTSRAYVTLDGGSTWRSIELPGEPGIDSEVRFDAEGHAFLVNLGAARDAQGRRQGAVLLYRSDDGGRTWREPAAGGLGEEHDHTTLTVDRTGGRFAGRLYVSTLYGQEEETRIGVFRSEDGGRTLTGPVEAANGRGKLLYFNEGLVVESDGTVVLILSSLPQAPESWAAEGRRRPAIWIAASSDGGATFGPPRPTALAQEQDLARPEEISASQFAAIPAGPFRDRILGIWTDHRLGPPRILISWSDDRGTTWTAPRPIDPGAPAEARQTQPALAVSGDGNGIGISWFDTRLGAGGNGYDQFFAVSLDGGATFLPPVRISSETSPFGGEGNMAPNPLTLPFKGSLRFMVSSAANRWPRGGDYQGLAVGSDGVFHPFWADNRTGTFQIQSARVTLTTGAPPAPAGLVEADVTSRVELVIDPTTYDAATRTGSIPVRLRNQSDSPIYGPLRVEVGELNAARFPPRKREVPLEILNATNGKTGPGAIFDFTPALGAAGVLGPGEVTGALVWKLRYLVSDPRPDFNLKVFGRVEEAP